MSPDSIKLVTVIVAALIAMIVLVTKIVELKISLAKYEKERPEKQQAPSTDSADRVQIRLISRVALILWVLSALLIIPIEGLCDHWAGVSAVVFLSASLPVILSLILVSGVQFTIGSLINLQSHFSDSQTQIVELCDRIVGIVKSSGEQGGADQPATAPESESEVKEKPKTESEGRSQ